MSINAIGSNIPIQVALGGLGVDTLTQYGVLYGNGTAAVGVTAVGTATNVLTSNGTGIAPTFQPIGIVPGGGAWVLVSTQTAVSVNTLNFTSVGSYHNYVFILNGFLSDTPNDTLRMNVSINNGSTWISAFPWGGRSCYIGNTPTWTQNPTGSGAFSGAPMSNNLMPTTGAGLGGTYFFYAANEAVSTQNLRGEWIISPDNTGVYELGISGSQFQDGTVRTINAFQLQMLLGNIASGTVSLYGLVS